LDTTIRHMDDRLCNTSTMNRKNPKIFHIGSHFIKVPQTVAWVTVNIAVWINSAGLGVAPLPAYSQKSYVGHNLTPALQFNRILPEAIGE